MDNESVLKVIQDLANREAGLGETIRSVFSNYPREETDYGELIWLCRHIYYSAALVLIKPRHFTEFHVHRQKSETIFALTDSLVAQHGINVKVVKRVSLELGQRYDFQKSHWHLIENESYDKMGLALEVSTAHDANDIDIFRKAGELQ